MKPTRGRYQVLEWLMFQMGGVGPMLGQAHHFRLYAPQKIPYAIERYTNEAKRVAGSQNPDAGAPSTHPSLWASPSDLPPEDSR